MRTLALDPGTRRIGLALSDRSGKFATPMAVLEVSAPGGADERILQWIKKEGVVRLVVGLPLNMDGSPGPAARAAAQWGRELAAKCKLPVIYVDERLSTFAAEERIVQRKRGGEKITRRAKKRRLDALAAAAFLQDFLDGKLQPIEAP